MVFTAIWWAVLVWAAADEAVSATVFWSIVLLVPISAGLLLANIGLPLGLSRTSKARLNRKKRPQRSVS
jgi:hypothetical protein